MGKRGPKPKGKVKIVWSSDFAYALGLLATDGNLSKDGRHITFTSKDKEQVNNFLEALCIKATIGKTYSGATGKPAFRVQISDILFHQFLVSIGITPNKSKTIREVLVPPELLIDFVRGVFDGDGSFHAYRDTRWKSSFMYYLSFATASLAFAEFLQGIIFEVCDAQGAIKRAKKSSVWQLAYAKAASQKIIKAMYHKPHSRALSRKKLKIKRILAIVGKR